MKAVTYRRYGSPDVLRYEEVEKPRPADDEVLVRVHAASVNAADWRLLRADPFFARLHSGLLHPKFPILGSDIAGRVEAVGEDVERFRPGDDVFGDLFECGLGGFAEYACARESALALKPANSSFEEAAAVPLAGGTALRGLRDLGGIRRGHRVLVLGASGGVGVFAVQIAKAFGAEVTAVCSTAKLELLRSLGADHVIDYRKEDFTRGGRRYDLILAANGALPLLGHRRALTPEGIAVITGGSVPRIFQAMFLGPLLSKIGGRRLVVLSSKPNQADLLVLQGLLETGKVAPFIDRRYPLSEAAEAIRYVEAGHASGKVVLKMVDDA